MDKRQFIIAFLLDLIQKIVYSVFLGKGSESMKKTKIVCSIGPASDNVETLSQMALAGMNVVRINCSHADEENRLHTLATTKETRKIPSKL